MGEEFSFLCASGIQVLQDEWEFARKEQDAQKHDILKPCELLKEM